MSYVHEPVTPPYTFSGYSRARPTGNDDANASPRAAPPPGKGGARAGYDDGGAPGRFMGHATRVLAFVATTMATTMATVTREVETGQRTGRRWATTTAEHLGGLWATQPGCSPSRRRRPPSITA